MPDHPTTTAIVRETGQSPYAVAIDVSGYRLQGDEPVSAGGSGLGPAPYDLLTASLAECTNMTVRWYALQHKWPLEKVETIVDHRKDGRQDIFEKRVRLYGNALTDEQRQQLIDVAKKCPVQRTLLSEPIITTIDAA